MFNKRSLVLALCCTLVAFAAGSFFTASAQLSPPAQVPTFRTVVSAPFAQNVSFTDEGQLFGQIYDTVSPSVVSINVTAQRPQGLVQGTGSGFVIDTDGHIITNNHVVQNATSIEVNFYDGTIVRGEVVGADPDSDLAVIKVDLPAEELSPVTFGDSDTLDIGQTVLAIGSPFGERWTLTSGIISALDRTITGLTNYSIGGVIQTDASINPGNSGGPLLDLQGSVIGVNSQIVTESGTNSGIGFAIPSNLVQRVAATLIEYGHVDYSYLGIQGADISLQVIEDLGLNHNQQGVLIVDIASGSPAADAGLQAAVVQSSGRRAAQRHIQSADIITAIDGEPISGMGQLISYLANHTQPRQEVTLTVLRDGQELQLSVRLDYRPSSSQHG